MKPQQLDDEVIALPSARLVLVPVVAVGTGVLVGPIGVFVRVGVLVGGTEVLVGVLVGPIGVFVRVGVFVGVLVGPTGVFVLVGVFVGVLVAVAVERVK